MSTNLTSEDLTTLAAHDNRAATMLKMEQEDQPRQSYEMNVAMTYSTVAMFVRRSILRKAHPTTALDINVVY